MQAADLAEGHIGAGRIIRIGNKYHARLGCHQRQHRVDIGGVVALRCHHGLCPIGADDDGIDEKSMRGINSLIAFAQIGIGEKLQQFI